MIIIEDNRKVCESDVIPLYNSNNWSSAKKPLLLVNGLNNSHSLVTAWEEDKLIGLGNAISDGHLVVYYPHLIVLPEYQKKGVGVLIIKHLQFMYKGYHQQMIVADNNAIGFYEKAGFSKAQNTASMWIYDGKDH